VNPTVTVSPLDPAGPFRSCQVAIQGCDEIESKNRPVDVGIVILVWQT
jgi:hypothetical protein